MTSALVIVLVKARRVYETGELPFVEAIKSGSLGEIAPHYLSLCDGRRFA
jgi:hypothetical protein